MSLNAAHVRASARASARPHGKEDVFADSNTTNCLRDQLCVQLGDVYFFTDTSFVISSNCCFCVDLIRENEGSISMIRLDNDNEPSHFVDAEINPTFNFYKPH